MSLSTKNIKLPEGKQSKTINPGNTTAMIYDISLKPGYNPDSYYLLLNIETKPIVEFEGFFIDPKDESKGRHQGQVGRVRSSQWAFETKTLPSGVKIDRNESILRTLITLAKELEVEDQLNEIEADTIEEFVLEANKVLCNGNYINFCIAGKEYTNKEGYIAYDLFIPKASNKKYGFSNNISNVITFNEKDHILPEKKKNVESVSDFEPNKESNSDFDLF
jgi:hypothetical protein